jgi:hypothetical protein
MVAVELLLTAAVDTVKLAEEAPGAIVTDGATVSVALEFARVTLAPPVGAAWLRLTVQMLEEFDPTLLGLHDKVDTETDASADANADADAVRFTVVLAELPL